MPRDAGSRPTSLFIVGALALAAFAIVVIVAGRPPGTQRPRGGVSSATIRDDVALAPSGSAPASAERPSQPLAMPPSGTPGTQRATPLWTSSWGTRLDQLGRDRPSEGAPLGPMSLTSDASGRIYVLDEINGRIVRRGADGRPEAEIRIDLRTPEDVVIAHDGSIAVLDRHRDKQVALYDASGAPKGKLPLGANPGEVTGLFVNGNDVYVERAHDKLVKLGDTSGTPAATPDVLSGRPSGDGTALLSAAIVDARAGQVRVSSVERSTGRLRFERTITLWPVVRAIVLLATDGAGIIYFAAEAQRQGAPPSIVLSCLEPIGGTVVGGALLPANTLPEETFKDFAVLEGGGVVHALRTETGVTYTRYDCR